MTRLEALRKLLALGELCRPEIEQVMGGDRIAVVNALSELHMSGDVLYVRDGRQQTYFRLTDSAMRSAFQQQVTA